MATTELRNDAKNLIIKILREEGYASYARLVEPFRIYLTDDPEVIGYMVPNRAIICLNKSLTTDQVSTIVRHEILHEYLVHAIRSEKVEKTRGLRNPELSNIAADFEISNKGYTAKDKAIARRIKIGDNILRGLVTEDEYPDWQYLSFEEMYNKLLDESEKDSEKIKQLIAAYQKISKKNLDDIESEIEDIKDNMNSASSDKSSPESQISKAADELDKKLDDVRSKIENSSDKTQEKGGEGDGIFQTPEEQRDAAAIAKQVAEIEKLLNDLQLKQDILDDTARARRKEQAAHASRDADKYHGSGLQQFKLNLNRFIASQLEETEEDSYTRINPSYEDSEFILPGRINREAKYIPRINVYWDVSPSFSNPAKTAAARKAIETLNRYVLDGDIAIDTFYFASRVSDNPKDCGGGTNGRPIQEHIAATNPDNVIIITDSDISDCRGNTVVPGAVWMLFYDSRSDNLINHITGKRQTKIYDIDYRGV